MNRYLGRANPPSGRTAATEPPSNDRMGTVSSDLFCSEGYISMHGMKRRHVGVRGWFG